MEERVAGSVFAAASVVGRVVVLVRGPLEVVLDEDGAEVVDLTSCAVVDELEVVDDEVELDEDEVEVEVEVGAAAALTPDTVV